MFVLFFRCFDVSEGVWTRLISMPEMPQGDPLAAKAKFAGFSCSAAIGFGFKIKIG